MRTCKRCGETKEEFAFGVSVNSETGREYPRKTCIKCQRVKCKERALDWQLEYRYGITRVHWEMILKSQNNKCKLCGREFDNRDINVDHNHKTMVIRGLLCDKCNVSLGGFKDDPVRLRAAADYLETANALKELYCEK